MPPSSAGWPPDRIVEALERLDEQQRDAERRQRRTNVQLVLLTLGVLVVSVVALAVAIYAAS